MHLESKKKFNLKDLAQFDGTDDKPAYLAFEGRIIDVSTSQHWHHGHHMGSHQAGRGFDAGNPSRSPRTGNVREFPPGRRPCCRRESQRKIPPFLAWVFHRIPLLRRHPHPMLVHFPMVFFISTTGFNLLYLLTGDPSFETTAWHCLWGGVLFLPLAIATGLFTWWINYEAEWLRQVKIKLVLAPLLFFLALSALLWRYFHPEIIISCQRLSLVYWGLIFSFTPLAIAIGWYRGLPQFPLERMTTWESTRKL